MFPFFAAPRAVAVDFNTVVDATQLYPVFASRYLAHHRAEITESERTERVVPAVGE
jgi:hypothetical protein